MMFYQRNIIRLVFPITLLIGASITAECQNEKSENPFDIPTRKVEKQKSNQVNTFDVESRLSSEGSATKKNVSAKNPFEVSHIPLKKKISTKKSITKSTPKSKNSTNILWILFLVLVALAVIINTNKGLINRTFHSVFNENTLKGLQKDENGGLSVHFILLYLIFFVSLSIFLLLSVKTFTGADHDLSLPLVLAGAFIIYLIKHVLLFLVALIYPIRKEIAYYNFTLETYSIITGIILIPVNFILAFGLPSLQSTFVYLGLFFTLSLLLMVYLRGLLVSLKHVTNNFFYFFIYLCTLEIAPLVLFTKIIVQSF